MIKNPKLRRPIGKKKRTKGPTMYESPLFPGAPTPTQKGSVVVPDPDLEPIEPEDETETEKAIAVLKAAMNVAETVEPPAVDVSEPMMKAEPDTTGKLEGKFQVSLEQMIKRLNDIVRVEYSQWMRYYHYYLVLRGHARDAIAAEFKEHAEQELEHAERVAMRIIGLGGYPVPEMGEQPLPLKDTEEIIKELLRREQEGMQLYREVHALCGANEGTRQVLEGNMELEQEHIDDLWRYLKNPELLKANMSAGEFTQKPEKQTRAAYSHSFARDTEGVSGQTTPDLPERGRDWHGTVPGVPDEPKADEEDEKKQQDAHGYFNELPDLLHRKLPKKDEKTQTAIKALAGAPRFSRGPVIPPTARDFLLQFGFTDEEIQSGSAEMTPRMRSLYNRDLLTKVRKSLTRLEG
jgi:bacterioferritin